ncbi:MAG TPA: hypothetical protein VKR56_14875 [Candidatus Cybelea sp.]|nr:hypothetical protein [Candidatus Cybelea sp.]
MLRITKIAAAASTAAIIFAPAIVRADTPGPTLVYNFTYSAKQAIQARDSGNSIESVDTENEELAGGNADNGISHYGGFLDDKGTMTVQVVGTEQDGGLVVNISEAGQQTRRAPAATCVVYGSTRVICDPNKTVYTEEYTLLRFLGGKFVDPSQLDANKHWTATGLNGPGLTVLADYTINSNDNGQMQIGEKRIVKASGVGHLTTDVETKIGYDFNRSLPVSVNEYAAQYTDGGLKGTSTTIYQTTLQLVSDTMAKT